MRGVLDIVVRHRLGDMLLDARFVAEGAVTALFGPSGSGKTSLLNVIAGLLRPDEGVVRFGGRVLADSRSRHFLPVHKRRFGYVFQDARLFPHLTVRQNLLYGHWMSGQAGAPEALDRVVGMLALGALLPRKPAGLSGGERQRVAIGRALLAGPDLLLMDEPLAALDDERKAEILSYIETVIAASHVPILYVSHSVPEVLRLASHVGILDKGRMTAFGPLPSMLSGIGAGSVTAFGEPMALLESQVVGSDPAFGMVVLDTPLGRLDLARPGLNAGVRLRVRILASDVMISAERPALISAQNILPATIAQLETVPGSGGSRVDVRLVVGSADIIARITSRAVEHLSLSVGKSVHAIIKSVAIET